MGPFHAVGFLAFVLCIVSCLAASAEVQEGVITSDDATQAVQTAKTTTENVFTRAQNNLSTANGALERVKSYEAEAKRIELDAEQAATGYENASQVLQKIKDIYKSIRTLYLDAKGKLDNAVTNLGKLKIKAEELKGQCNTEALVIKDTEKNYAEIKNKASEISKNATELDQKITTELALINNVQSTEETMKKSLTDAKLANSEASTIIAVTEIQSMIGAATINFQETENKKNEVNVSVQETLKVCTTELIRSNKIIENQCKSADDALTSAIGAVKQAQSAMAVINKKKGLADTALENVQKPETDVNKAEEAANAAKACVVTAQQNVVQLNNALETVKTSLTKANDANQEIKRPLSKATSEERTKQTKEKDEETNPPVVYGTVPHQKDTTIQPTIISTELPTSKDLPNQSKTNAEKLKDALIKGAQNVSTTALTGGKALAPGANNDSAMTVSVPLLVALIASAVLQ